MPRKKATTPTGSTIQPVSGYRYDDATRRNNPPAGLASHGSVRPAPKLRYTYDPHLPPVLRFDSTGRSEYLDALIGRAIGGTLSEEDGALLRELLGSGAPWLEWAGKREAQAFTVDPVALHIHERALRGTIDAERFDALTGTTSLPFSAGKHGRVAVKVIDPRGNEVMRVSRLPEG